MRTCFAFLSFLAAACGTDSAPPAFVPPPPPPPDAPPSLVPRDARGTYAVHSDIDVPLPAAATTAFAPLVSATNGADDPSRYLLDKLVDQLPTGTLKTLARDAVPLLAPYLNAQLATLAPRLQPGLVAITRGLDTISRHIGTTETWQVDARGDATRIATGARFELGGSPIEVRFADAGQDDRVATAQLALDPEGRVTIAMHRLPLGYGALVRLGLDRAVVPSVDPAARDLATALGDLFACDKLGEWLANELGVGTPALYASACTAAAIAIADDLESRIVAIDAASPLALELAGTAQGLDHDGNGSLDELRTGAWTGTFDNAGPIGAATFSGMRTE